MRLRDGDYESEGRVEVYLNDAWHTVCDDSWDIEDALVVCRQLGYEAAIQAPLRAHFGKGIGLTVGLTEVNCDGSEEGLSDCTFVDQDIFCDHTEDASAVCGGTYDKFEVKVIVQFYTTSVFL